MPLPPRRNALRRAHGLPTPEAPRLTMPPHPLLRLLVLLALVRAALGQQVELTVLGPDQRGIAGATAITYEDSVPGRTETGADGRCRLPLAPGPRTFRLRVEKPGWFHQEVQWLAQEKLTAHLVPAAPLAGEVRFAGDRQPAAGAEVELVHPACKSCAPERAIADELGRFRFAEAPCGSDLELRVGAPRVPYQKIKVGAVVPGDSQPRLLEIERGHALRGRVVDFASGAGLAGARVGTIPGGLNQAVADAEGRFELLCVPESFRQLIRFEVAAEGHCRLGVTLMASELQPGKELRCPLPGFAAVSGVVRDAQGEPVSGAQVFVREDPLWLSKRRLRGAPAERIPLDELPPAWNVASGVQNAQTTTDAQGRFRFERVCPWTAELLMQSQHPVAGGFQRTFGPVPAPGGTLEVELSPERAPPGGTVSGSVTLNGQPVQGLIEWRGPQRSGQLFVDPRGSYRGSGIEAGEVELRVAAVQLRNGTLGTLFHERTARVAVALDSEVRHDFALEHALERVEAQLRGPDGQPREGVAVGATCARLGLRLQAASDAQGRASIEVPKLEDGWNLSLLHGPLLLEREGVRPGGEPVLFELPELGRLRVRFRDERTGAQLAPAMVLWRRAGAPGFEPRNLPLEADKSAPGWSFATIPLGSYEIGAWVGLASYPPSAPIAVEVRPGEVREIDFQLREGQPCAFQIPAGSPIPPRDPSALIWVLEERWWTREDAGDADSSRRNVPLPALAERFRRLEFDPAGRAQVPGLEPGRYRFVPSLPSDRVEPEAFDFDPQRSTPIEVRWVRKP